MTVTTEFASAAAFVEGGRTSPLLVGAALAHCLRVNAALKPEFS